MTNRVFIRDAYASGIFIPDVLRKIKKPQKPAASKFQGHENTMCHLECVAPFWHLLPQQPLPHLYTGSLIRILIS